MNLEALNINVRFGDTHVLKDISHTFKEGKITIILGPNGCGKTTLIKSVVKMFAKKCGMSYIQQEIYGNIGLTVSDLVALGRYNEKKFFNSENEEDLKKIDEALELMELKDKKDQLYDTLSGGEKQRCMAARAICQDAEWFIMDEPASNLDIVHSKFILDTARDLVKNQGKSFIIVMHDLNEASTYGDEFVLMKDGRITDVCDRLSPDKLADVFETKFGSVKTPSGKDVFYAD